MSPRDCIELEVGYLVMAATLMTAVWRFSFVLMNDPAQDSFADCSFINITTYRSGAYGYQYFFTGRMGPNS